MSASHENASPLYRLMVPRCCERAIGRPHESLWRTLRRSRGLLGTNPKSSGPGSWSYARAIVNGEPLCDPQTRPRGLAKPAAISPRLAPRLVNWWVSTGFRCSSNLRPIYDYDGRCRGEAKNNLPGRWNFQISALARCITLCLRRAPARGSQEFVAIYGHWGSFSATTGSENDGEPSPCSLEWTTTPGGIRGYISFQLVADEARFLVPRTTDRYLEPGSTRSLEALLRFEKNFGTAR
jgi:hypothetical protein